MTLSQKINLSYYELCSILNILQIESIPGLDKPAPPQQGPNEELALRVAERSLMARGLVQNEKDSEDTKVHNSLLNTIGICAYGSPVLFMYHWSTSNASPNKTFAHFHEEQLVLHEQASLPQIHQFTRYESHSPLWSIVKSQGIKPEDVTPENNNEDINLLIEPALVDSIRDLARNNDDQSFAKKILLDRGYQEDTINQFLETFDEDTSFTVFQILTLAESGGVSKKDFMLLGSSHHLWLALSVYQNDSLYFLFRKTDMNAFVDLAKSWLSVSNDVA